MPIYEYRCKDCTHDTSVFVRSPKSAAEAVCEHCGSVNLARKISTVARRRSLGDVVAEYGIPDPGEGIRDPRQIGHWVEERFKQFGVDVPQSTRSMIDAARDGEMPEGLDL